MVNVEINKLFESKVLGILLLGIILYLGSVYLNIQKENSAEIGIYFSEALILVSFIFQIIMWTRYLDRKVISVEH